MKPTLFILCASLLIFNFSSCQKKDTKSTGEVVADSIFFNYGGGFMPYPVWQYFKVTEEASRRSTTNVYKNAELSYYDFIVPAKNHAHVKYILNEVPSQMLLENNEHYASKSTIVDCGRYEVVAYVNGIRYRWTFTECSEGMVDHAFVFLEKIKSISYRMLLKEDE